MRTRLLALALVLLAVLFGGAGVLRSRWIAASNGDAVGQTSFDDLGEGRPEAEEAQEAPPAFRSRPRTSPPPSRPRRGLDTGSPRSGEPDADYL